MPKRPLPSEDEDAEAVVDEAETAEVRAEPESEDAEVAVEAKRQNPSPKHSEAETSEATDQSDAAPPDEPAEESGGRIRRWLRGRGNG